MKKIFVFLLGSTLLFFSSFSLINADFWDDIFDNKKEIPYCNDGDCGLDDGIEEIEKADIEGLVTKGTASEYIQKIVAYLLSFLAIIAVIIIIYAGFNILTAAGEEEKVKNSKKMIMYAIIGLAVIYLAGPITRFIIGIFSS